MLAQQITLSVLCTNGIHATLDINYINYINYTTAQEGTAQEMQGEWKGLEEWWKEQKKHVTLVWTRISDVCASLRTTK